MVEWFDDLKVGMRFKSESKTVSREEILRFASEFDPQPFHLDPTAAEHSFFHGLSASGWHTAALAMRLFVEAVPIAGGIVGAGVELLEWKAPVRPGDELRLGCQVVEIRPSKSRPDRGIVRFVMTIATVADEVDDYVGMEAMAVLGGDGGDADDGVGVFGVDVEDGRGEALGDVSGEARGVGLLG